MDAKKIILCGCILLTRTYKPRSLDVKNTNRCESHQKGNHLPSLCMLHPTLYTSLLPPHVLHSAMKWEAFDSLVAEWKSWNCTFLETVQYTHTTPHFTVYITHFTFQSMFLQALLLMQTEHLFHCIQCLTKHMIIKAWVKIQDSILHHHKWISKMGFTCLLYTPWNIFHTSLCTFLWNIWHITWRMFQRLLVFTINTISLWPSVLDADIKCSLVGQLLITLWGKWYHSTFF
jgi:hypothetical protein